MKKSFLLLVLATFPLFAMAQASGGQITRPNDRSTYRSSHNMRAKTTPNQINRDKTKVSEPDNYINGHGYVDLGLPSGTKWATCNVGANTPEEYGYYLAWGEIEPKNEYKWKETPLFGATIDDISNNQNYDVAKIKWGDGWAIPTKHQWDELMRYCKLKVIKKNGISGLLFIGKKGKSVFFFFFGKIIDTLLQFESCDGYYWSSNADYTYQGDPAYTPNGFSTNFHTSTTSDGIVFSEPASRGDGHNVRPVTK